MSPTPLTLMLGQIEDAINDPTRPLAETDQRRLDSAHRNALRLLKLVNSLLDFSRIEAGRVQATYTATDLAAVTVELTSVFRSTVEKAGLTLIVDCAPLPEPRPRRSGHVGEDCAQSSIQRLQIHLRGRMECAPALARGRCGTDSLGYRDARAAGARFPAVRALPPCRNARGRTYEGSGIGLALVQELVKLHGGVIRVDSVLDEGTTFTVTIPRGTAHLPTDRSAAQGGLASTSIGARTFLQEALGWLPDDLTVEPGEASPPRCPSCNGQRANGSRSHPVGG